MNPDAGATTTAGTFTGTNSFYNLTLSPTITDNRSYNFGSGAIEVDGDFTINPSAGSSLALTVNAGADITVGTSGDRNKTTSITGAGAGPATSALNLRPSTTDYNLTTGLLNVASAGTLDATGAASVINLNATSTTALFTRVGTFTAGSSTVKVGPDADVTLTSGTFTGSNAFYNLYLVGGISASRVYSFGAAAVEINGNFTVSPSADSNYSLTAEMNADITVAPGKTTTITGTPGIGTPTSRIIAGSLVGTNYTLSTGFLDINRGSVFMDDTTGAVIINLTGTTGSLLTISTNGNYIFDGDGATGPNPDAEIIVSSASGSPSLSSFPISLNFTFYKLTINSTATVINMGSAWSFYSFGSPEFNLQNGVFNVDANDLTGPGAFGTLTISNGATLCLGGTTNATTATCNSGATQTATRSMPTFNTYAFGNTSTVRYLSDSGLAQTVSATPVYGNLIFAPTLTNSITYTLGGVMTINGDFTINPASSVPRILTVNAGGNITVGTSSDLNKTVTLTGATSGRSLLDLRPSTTDYDLTTGLLNVATAGTLDASAAASTITLNATSTTALFTRVGTFTAGSSTVKVETDADVTLTSGTFTGSNAFYNLALGFATTFTTNRVYTFGAGAIEVGNDFNVRIGLTGGGNLAVDLGADITVTGDTLIQRNLSGDVTLDTTASNYNLTLGGNLTISNGGTLAANDSTITVSGNYTNSAGTFTAGTSDFVLDGASTQTLTGNLVGATKAFYDLTITNNSGTAPSDCEITSWVPSVDFAGTASTTNNFTITTASTKVEFNSGSLYSFQNINWNGQAAGTPIYFRNSAASGTWNLAVLGTQTAVSYVDVSRSDASYGSTVNALDGTNTDDCDNNTNWDFPYFIFSVTTDNFPTITPGGSAVFATSTLSVDTNYPNGWQVILSGDNQGSGVSSTTMYWRDSSCAGTIDYGIQIPDQTEWVPGIATTSAGNAVQIGSLDSSAEVLAFRVMTASGSTPFTASSWWGAADNYTDSASTLWAGIASSTANNLKIGESSVDSGGSAVLNTVLYYLKLPTAQESGCYQGDLTFTGTPIP